MSSFNIKNDLTWRDFLIRLGLIIITVAIIVWMMPRSSQNNFKIEKGRPWIYNDLKAPFDFPIYKSDEAVKAERDSLMKQYEPYYILNSDVVGKQLRQFSKDYSNGIPGLNNDYLSIISNRIRRLYDQGIMSNSDYAKIGKDTTKYLRIVNGKHATSIQVSKVYSVVSAYEQIFEDEVLAAHRDILQKCNLNDYITPNLKYDKERSEASLNDLQNSIPLASGLVQRGEKIIDRGDIVDGKTYNKLLSFQKEMERQNVDQEKIRLNIMGQILYTAILLTCFTIFLTLFRKDYFEKVRSTAMIYALIVLFTGFQNCLHGSCHNDTYMCMFPAVSVGVRGSRTCSRIGSHLLTT